MGHMSWHGARLLTLVKVRKPVALLSVDPVGAGAGGSLHEPPPAPPLCRKGELQRSPIVIGCNGSVGKVTIFLAPAGAPNSAFQWMVPKGAKEFRATATLSPLPGSVGSSRLRARCVPVEDVDGLNEQGDAHGNASATQLLRKLATSKVLGNGTSPAHGVNGSRGNASSSNLSVEADSVLGNGMSPAHGVSGSKTGSSQGHVSSSNLSFEAGHVHDPAEELLKMQANLKHLSANVKLLRAKMESANSTSSSNLPAASADPAAQLDEVRRKVAVLRPTVDALKLHAALAKLNETKKKVAALREKINALALSPNGSSFTDESDRGLHLTISEPPKPHSKGPWQEWFTVEGELPCDALVRVENLEGTILNGNVAYTWAGVSPCPEHPPGCEPCPKDACGPGTTAMCDGSMTPKCAAAANTEPRPRPDAVMTNVAEGGRTTTSEPEPEPESSTWPQRLSTYEPPPESESSEPTSTPEHEAVSAKRPMLKHKVQSTTERKANHETTAEPHVGLHSSTTPKHATTTSKHASNSSKSGPGSKSAKESSSVGFRFTVHHLDYTRLKADSLLMSAVSAQIKHALASAARVPEETVLVQLSSGSVVVDASIRDVPWKNVVDVELRVGSQATFANNLAKRISGILGIDAVTSGEVSVGSVVVLGAEPGSGGASGDGGAAGDRHKAALTPQEVPVTGTVQSSTMTPSVRPIVFGDEGTTMAPSLVGAIQSPHARGVVGGSGDDDAHDLPSWRSQAGTLVVGGAAVAAVISCALMCVFLAVRRVASEDVEHGPAHSGHGSQMFDRLPSNEADAAYHHGSGRGPQVMSIATEVPGQAHGGLGGAGGMRGGYQRTGYEQLTSQ